MLSGYTLRNRYKIIKPLGSGSFGITYLAEDLDLPDHPLCVVKNLQQSYSPEELEVIIAFFNKEAKALYRLGRECSQIPQLFAHFEEGGEFYLVQEYIDGHDLSKEIFSGNRLSEAQVTQLLKDILEVLAIIHDKNIIHRDIKAQNLMRRNSDGKIILIDFGTVKEISQLKANPLEQTNITIAIGTAGYMPTEQLSGYPKLASDIYAVGMLGIYALTGVRPQELPKDHNTFEVIWRDKASVSPFLANVLDKMVRYKFQERYQTAREALQALTKSSGYIPLPTLVSNVSQPRQANKRKFLIGAGVTVSLVFAIGFLSIAFLRQRITNTDICPETSALSTPTRSSDWEKGGIKYYGELKDDQPHGCGVMTFASGSSIAKYYEGRFSNGKFFGKGTLVYYNGDKYEGEFKENLFHGKGILRLANGTVYEGQFSNNKYEGIGKLFYINGCRYEGEFKNNKPDGQGTCIPSRGSPKTGIWHQGKIEGENNLCCV